MISVCCTDCVRIHSAAGNYRSEFFDRLSFQLEPPAEYCDCVCFVRVIQTNWIASHAWWFFAIPECNLECMQNRYAYVTTREREREMSINAMGPTHRITRNRCRTVSLMSPICIGRLSCQRAGGRDYGPRDESSPDDNTPFGRLTAATLPREDGMDGYGRVTLLMGSPVILMWWHSATVNREVASFAWDGEFLGIVHQLECDAIIRCEDDRYAFTRLIFFMASECSVTEV